MLNHPPTDIVDTHPHTTIIEINDDYCDACGTARVPAKLYAQLPNQHTLAFCGHHGTQHLTALQAKGATIIDLRHTTDPT